VVAEADHLYPRLVAVGHGAQGVEYLLFGTRRGQRHPVGTADLLGYRGVDQRVDGRVAEQIEHAGLRGRIGADVASTKAGVVTDGCGLVRHEVTPVSRRRTIRRELW
jgi:hypothetical protein